MQLPIHNLSCEVIFMYGPIFYRAGRSDALQRAEDILRSQGCQFASEPGLCVTHLLLDVPSFRDDGMLRSGDSPDALLPAFSPQVKIYGGLLGGRLSEYQTVDLLDDPFYTAENARITAHCAVKLAMERLPRVLYGCPVLIVGWGRIGKCLGQLLQAMGAKVTVAARKATDRAMADTLGYDTLPTEGLGYSLVRFRVIFNTAPELVLPKESMIYAPADCLLIDLASRPGMESPDVIWARGLPSKDAPESAAALIAKTILRLR